MTVAEVQTSEATTILPYFTFVLINNPSFGSAVTSNNW